MKLTNYNYGGPQEFGCWIRGKIVVSLNEWYKIQRYLFSPTVLAKLGRDSGNALVSRMLQEDMERRVFTRKGFVVNIRVSATDAVIRRFKPQNARRYKRQNYMFHILT